MTDIGLTVATWGALACSAIWTNSPRQSKVTEFAGAAFLVIAVVACGLNTYKFFAG